MKFNHALIYIAFFACIGTACYVTKSGLPLFALIFTPNMRIEP